MSEQSPGSVVAVLLVEDSVTDALLMKRIIEAAGPFEVTTATDGDTGAALIVSQTWAFAIVDAALPGKDGIEVIQIGRERHPDLPIILFSDTSNASLIDAAYRAGAEFTFSKPVDPEEVRNKLKEFSNVESDPVETEHTPTVVAVGARPGDVEMGCGGVLWKHREEGHRIVIVNLAGGGDPHSDLAAATRVVADILDAQMENTGDETHHVVDLDQASSTLEKVFGRSKPGMLYVPTASSNRPGSVESHRVALALGEAIPNVLAYQDPASTVDFRPQFFIDVAPYMERKLHIVALYDTFGFENMSTELAKATARFWGRFADSEYVEPLEVIRRGSA